MIETEIVRERNRFVKAGGNATVRVATISTSTAHSGFGTAVDTLTLSDGDEVLDWNNGTATDRGLWVAHAGAWTRSKQKLIGGMLVTVVDGSAKKDSVWLLDTQGTITPGTTALHFFQITQNIPFVIARAKTSSGVTHSGLTAVDGVTIVAGDVVFDDPSTYIVASGAWTITASSPKTVFVTEGTANGPLIYGLQASGAYKAISGAYS